MARTSFCVIRIGLSNHIGIGATIQYDAFAVISFDQSDDAILIDDAGEEHFRDHFDDSGTTYAANSDLRILLGKFRLVGPGFAADHAKTRFQCFRVDTHPFDRTRRGALAGRNLCTLEGRPGGAGGSQQAVAITQYDFSIGANVDQ